MEGGDIASSVISLFNLHWSGESLDGLLRIVLDTNPLIVFVHPRGICIQHVESQLTTNMNHLFSGS